MHDELIGYLLGALDDEEQKLVEEYLAAIIDARSSLQILQRGLEPLQADDGHLDPPAGLAARTCHIIRVHIESIRVEATGD